MKNKFCYKYDFRITINYLKPIFTYQIDCKVMYNNNQFYIDKLLIYGSSIEYPLGKIKKQNNNKQYYNISKHDTSNFNLINRKNIPNILNKIVKKHSLAEYRGFYQNNCGNIDSSDISSIPNKFWCNYNNRYRINKRTKDTYYWDKPCKENDDCPFYVKKNNTGRCIKGICEMPSNVKRIRYTKYDYNIK